MFQPDLHELRQLACQLLARGYRVFCSPELYWQTYCFYSDGTRIAYAQQDRLQGLSFATVHKPNPTSGTGFKVDCVNDMVSAEEALRGCPGWAASMRTSSEPYRDLAAFLASRRGQNLIEVFAADLESSPFNLKENDVCPNPS